jgi:hypothetical protein
MTSHSGSQEGHDNERNLPVKISNIQAYPLRGPFYVLVLLALYANPFASAQRNAPSQTVDKPSSTSKGLVGVANPLPANIIVVTNTNDSGPGSLRDALAVANDGDTIDATGVSGTILLTSSELQITQNVIINGPGAGNLAVNGNATFRVFENFTSDVTISGLTITNGFTADANGGGGILNHGGLTVSDSSLVSNSVAIVPTSSGGGISNTEGATLTVTGSMINDNFGSCRGGGIYATNAQLTVMNSTISGNWTSQRAQCAGNGGGIFYNGGGTLTVMNTVISGNSAVYGGGIGSDLPFGTTATITDSTVSGNVAQWGGVCDFCGSGGGIFNHEGQTLTVTNTTIRDNGAVADGGGISNGGSLTVNESTISGNSVINSGVGGGISNSGNLSVTNGTLSGNSAGWHGGGIYNYGGSAQIGNTVLNAGSFGETIFNDGGTIASSGYNLSSDNGGGVLTGPGDQINTDPLLGPLQDNGGPTFTQALLPGSPAINAGDPSFKPPPDYDQRGPGFDRVVNGRIDIGSFEVQGSTPTPTPRPSPTARPRPAPHPRP